MLFKNLTAQVRKSLAYGVLGTLALGLYSEATLAQTKLIGYIPSYAGLTAVADRTDFAKLTHINIAFVNPTANGAIGNDVGPMCMVSPREEMFPKEISLTLLTRLMRLVQKF